MSNPFDQFDSVEEPRTSSKNPFDQFDSQPIAESMARVDGLKPQPEWMVNHLAKQPKARSFTEAATDTGRGVMKSLAGVADAAMHTADFIEDAIPLGGLAWEEGDILPSYKTPGEYQAAKEQGMATPTDATGQAMDYWEQGKSAAIKQDAQYLADADGFVDTFKRAAERPRAIGNAIADSIGYMVPGMAAARAAKVAGATGAGVAGAVAGTGAVVEGGAARSQAVGEVMDMPLGQLLERSPDYQALVKSGVDPEAARMRVAADAGFTAQAIAMPVSFLASKITGAAKAEGDFFTGQGAKDFFTGLFKQAGEEAAQEVGSQFGVNVGVAENADEGRVYTENLGNAAAMGAIMGPAQQAGMKAIDVAGQQLRSIGPVNVQDDGEVDLPMNGEQLGGGIVEELPSEPLQLGHDPQRMIVMPDGTTAWESEVSDLPPSAADQHPAFARLRESPEEIESSLSGDVDIDNELAELMADLDRAETMAREAAPMVPPGVNPFDRFDQDAQPEDLFGGIRQAQAEQADIARAREAENQRMAMANFQEEDEGGLFSGVRTLAEQSRYEPVRSVFDPAETANVYPPDPAVLRTGSGGEMRTSDPLPSGLNDNRLTRPEYRAQLERMASELVKGGGVGYVRDENDRITGRTPSINPEWFKALGENPETSMSVSDTQAAISKALAGERLGVRQARVVGAALDSIGEQRGSYAREIRAMRENARADRRKAYEDWLAATNAPVDAEFEAAVWPDSPGEAYSETDYLPESTMESRAISELAATADSYGVEWNDIDAALEAGDIDAQTKALTQLIWNAKNEHRKTAKQSAQERSSAPSGPGSSSGPTETLETKPANEAQSSAEVIDSAATEAATSPDNNLPEPTEAQKEAGNYKKAHVKIHGLDIAIENPRGSIRSGTDKDGKQWSVTMHNHYGYIKRTEGADGDHVDVFIGPNPDSDKVFVVDQLNPDGTFDEHKVLMAFDSKLKARSGYKSNYSNGWKVGPITSMSIDEFKDWVKNGDTKKPLSSALIASQPNEQKPGKIESTPAISESKTPKSESNDASPAVKDYLTPEILTESKNKYPGKMARERGIKKGSPGYADAMKKVEADYEVELDRAQAALPFEEFNRLNSDSPEAVNRQAWEALREEYGTDDMRYSLGHDSKRDISSLKSVFKEMGVDALIFEGKHSINLTKIVVPKDKRNMGLGTAAIKELVNYADTVNKRIVLDPSADFGGSKLRLKSFYKRFGFVENAGANRDHEVSEGMYRDPQGGENNRTSYSLGEGAGITVDSAQAVIDRIRKAWKNPHIKIEAVENIDGMPEPIKARIVADKVPNEKVKAVYHNGAVYVNASAMVNALDVERAVFHEVHGHYGARALFGKDTSIAMGRLYLAIGGEKGIRDIAKKHNIDLSKYEQILKGESPGKRAEIMADELLAHIAQDSKPSIKRWLQELIGAIRTWLRAHGFTGLGKFSDSEVMALLKRTREAATELKLEGGSVLRVLLDVAESSATADTTQAAYSLSGLPPKTRKVIDNDPVLAAWTLLAQDDLAFQLPVSDKKNLGEIFSDVAPGVQIRRAPELDDDGAKVWALNPDKDVLALVYEKGKSVWIDVADYSPGQSGSEIYNAVANYAYNTGKTFIGDPAGLSDKAMSRRLENMLSSALKFGTTDHLWPHEKQEKGGAGVPPINWKAGDDAHNLKEMISASYHATLNQFPEIQGLRYNPETDQIEGVKDGKIFSPGALKEIAASKRDSGIASGQPVTAGRKTLERAILTHTISRATRQEQLDVLARLGMQSSERLAGILYSLAPDTEPETRPSGGFSVSGLQENPIVYGISIDSILRVWQDKMRPLLRTQRAIVESGGTINEKSNAYLAEEAFHGKTENDLRKMRERYLEPMARRMAAYDITRDELDMYLWAKHAQERNAQIAKINPEMPDGGSGMTNAQASQILEQAKREGKRARLDELADIVYMLLDEKRKIMRHSLADDSMVDTWNSTYKYYVPLKGRAVDDSGGSYPRVGRGFDIRGKESLRALGRRTKPESPTLHAIKDTTESIIRYRKNEVGNALLALVEANPNPEYWEAYDKDSPDFERRLLKKDGREVVGAAKVINKEDYFITKRDGKEFYIRIEDPLLMRAMKNMGPEKMNWVVRQLAKVSRFLSSMVTSYNPEFVLTNFSRDIQTAILNLQAEIDLHDGKAKGKQITGKMIKGVPLAARAVYASLRNKKLTGSMADWQQSFDDFRNDGANTGWFQLLDIEQQASELKDLMDMNKANFRGQFLKNRKRIGDFVSNINSAVENAIRLSVYKNAVDAGITRKQAASLAKNLTVNFNRKGEVGASVNALFMFFNASVQGTAAFARAMGKLKIDENGKRKLNIAQKAAIGIMIASYGLALLNRGSAGEDEDGENWWDKVPDYVKERNLVLMKSIWGGKEGEYITIPLPYGYNVFNALATSTDSALHSNKGIGESAGAMVKAMMGAFSPIGVAESSSFAGAATRTLAPTAVKPLADLAANENFFGSKAYQENFEFGVKKPESNLHLRSTNDFWVWTAEFLNEATGGSAYRSGLIDVSPDKMGYMFNYFVGGAGQFYSRIVHLGIKGAQDREIEAVDVPFVRRFTGKVNWYPDQQKFFERKEKIDQVVAELKKLPLNSAERTEFKNEHGKLIELSFVSNSVANALTNLRKQRNKILDDERLSEKQKEENLKPIELKMKAQIDRFNAAYLKKHQG